MSFFSVDSLSAGYGKNDIIGNISFRLDSGTVTGVLGANGGGKTTLLKAICGILPHNGSCCLDGAVLENLPPRQLARLCSYIPQRSGIGIDISVLDVVLMGFNPKLGLLESPSQTMKDAAVKTLEQVGLGGMEHTNYLRLSEGQKQLCILARTLVSECKLLLLDEPESALDFRHRYHMLDLIGNWVQTTHGSAIIALHDPMLAINYCDKLLLVSDGRLLDTLLPREMPPERLEQALSNLYGPVSLHACTNRNGETVLAMLREEKT